MPSAGKRKPRPAVAPYLSVHDARKALDYYQAAFGAVEMMRWVDPDNGRIGHAEIRIGERSIYLADEYPETTELGLRSPLTLGGSSFQFWLTVDDVDGVTERAVAAGGKLLRAVEQSAQDGRRSRVEDPCGHIWTISSH
ncbi:VOC family protein, partial [Nevskia soli]|uniref:VOC family protein n=1 Tax=Nevskia soli TaxID=418856 RepID=UPI0004A72CE6